MRLDSIFDLNFCFVCFDLLLFRFVLVRSVLCFILFLLQETLAAELEEALFSLKEDHEDTLSKHREEAAAELETSV